MHTLIALNVFTCQSERLHTVGFKTPYSYMTHTHSRVNSKKNVFLSTPTTMESIPLNTQIRPDEMKSRLLGYMLGSLLPN